MGEALLDCGFGLTMRTRIGMVPVCCSESALEALPPFISIL